MTATTKTRVSRKNVTQLSPMPDVITRLGEISRRLKMAWLHCDCETHRKLLANAEHEICRGKLLLEAELNRSSFDTRGA